jgi:hypothetical protein
VIEALGKWQRANLEIIELTPGSIEYVDAMIRSQDAASMLDVMTGGWFSRWRGEPVP